LQHLRLSGNQLRSLPPEIARLNQLQALRLGDNKFTVLPPEIGQLTALQFLAISSNSLTTLPPEIAQLKALQTLIVNGNELEALPPEFGQLISLTSISLSDNRLREFPQALELLTQLRTLVLNGNDLSTLPPELGKLIQLQSLQLRGNRLTELPSEIGQLIKLRKLDLCNNQLTSLPPELGRLTQLQSLKLEGNPLTALPSEIEQLSQLRTLRLGGTQLTMYPSALSQLTQLRTLHFSGTPLEALPPEIGQLAQLQSLELSGTRLKTLPSEIGQLSKLQSLQLGGTQLETLPPEIGQLSQLRSLQLSGSQLKAFPPEVGLLTQLQSLQLNGTQLTSFPPEIGQLTQLQSLQLGANRLTELTPEIGQLTQLQKLSLYKNRIVGLPPEIAKLSRLETLDLRNNPGFPLPPEILANYRDAQNIISVYLDYLAEQKRPLNEIKLVLVGEGSVGKTSLVNRLLYNMFDPNSSKTEGIAIHRWEITNGGNGERTSEKKDDSAIRVNLWDFGGQEIMHATHQFFLTKRTLYVLVLDSRLSEAENRLDYWLTLIRSFGGDSPIFIVGNKTDQHPLDLDSRGLLAEHPTAQAILETSCATGAGIQTLRETIAERIAELPHVNDPIITTWFEVKSELEALDEDYIPYHRYLELCREHNVGNPDSQRVLLGFLHDLGVVLHFPDPRLETTNILNPEWVTRGVYRILNTRLSFDEPGILTWDMLARILHDDPYQEKRLFIMDMMQKFELCYELPDRPNTYLLPDLLPREAPDTGLWHRSLRFEVHYPVLPSSILTRLIVRMHRHIHTHNGARCVWRTGVLLECDGNEALVRAITPEGQPPRITVAVRGPVVGRRELLALIRDRLRAIHDSIADLRTEEKVPVPGHPNIPPVDYKWLRDMERKGVPEFYPPGLTEPISVSQLLAGIEPQAARRRRGPRGGDTYITNIHGGQVGVIGDKADIDGDIHSS